MTRPAKRRFPWGALTLAFAAAAIVFLLAAFALNQLNVFPSGIVAVTPTVSLATATAGTGTPPPEFTPTPSISSPPTPVQSFWPPSANTVTDVLAIMGGISSIGTLLSFFGLLGRGAGTLVRRARRRTAS